MDTTRSQSIRHTVRRPLLIGTVLGIVLCPPIVTVG